MIRTLIASSLILPCIASATAIIGDSHVGGLKPYLSKHMAVMYRNGTTAKYWQKRNIASDRLIVMTGTNDYKARVPAATWLGRTDAICRKAGRCWIVSPPVYATEYRQALRNRNNVIWCPQYQTRDGIHFTSAGYRALADKILRKVR